MLRLRLSVLALLLTACGGLLDDGEDETAPDAEPPPAESVEPSCEVGERRCSEEIQEVCLRDGWSPIEVCASAERCDATHCKAEGEP